MTYEAAAAILSHMKQQVTTKESRIDSFGGRSPGESMIELALTYALGALVAGVVISIWIWRSVWPHRPVRIYNEA